MCEKYVMSFSSQRTCFFITNKGDTEPVQKLTPALTGKSRTHWKDWIPACARMTTSHGNGSF